MSTGTADNVEDVGDGRNSLGDVPVSPEHRSLKGNGSVQDADAQQMVITSLRAQIQDLVGQVTQLNNKLVKSYDRVSDLEDELHIGAAHLRNSSIKISQLELERSQHISALSTGLLVEISERKTEEAENALKGAEEAVSVMQQQLQELRQEKELAEMKARDIQASAGKTQWVEQRDGVNITRSLRLLSSHSPYQEFLLFAAHLRSIHTSTPQLPSMSTLLTLPFLQRLLTEDSYVHFLI